MPPAAQPLLLPCSPSSSLGSDLRDPCIRCRHGRCARVSPITNSQRARLCPCALCTPSGRTGPGTHVADIYVCGRDRRSSRAAGRGASAERDAQTPSSTHVDPAPALHRRTPSDSPYGRATVPTRLPGASKNWPQLFPLQGPLKSVRFPPESPRAWEQGSLPLALLLVHPLSTRQPANFGDPTRITSPPILKPLPQLPAPPGPALPFLRSLPQGDPLCPRSSLGRHCLPWLHVASSGNSPLLPRTG